MNEKDLEEIKEKMKEHPEYYKDDLGERTIDELTVNDFDFQGWLIPNLTLRRMLENLGFMVDKETNQIVIDNRDPKLDKVPQILEDDGMAYGAKCGKVTSCYVEEDGNIKIWF